MYLAISLFWGVIGVAFVLLLSWAAVAGTRVVRDRNRQARDRMLPP